MVNTNIAINDASKEFFNNLTNDLCNPDSVEAFIKIGDCVINKSYIQYMQLAEEQEGEK